MKFRDRRRKGYFVLSMMISMFLPFSITVGDVDVLGEPEIQCREVTPGTTINDLFTNEAFLYDQFDVDPGIDPEGDYLGWIVFTRDGERVIVTNRLTDNITIFDWASMNVLANVDVGDYPGGLAVTDSHIVVACAFSDEVYIIGLDDYSIDTVFVLPVGQQPWVVRTSPDGSRAYVACDISNTCEIFNLQTYTHEFTIVDFPVALVSYGWNSENGRNGVTFTNFEVTRDGAHLIVGDWEDTLFFYDAMSGAVDDFIVGVPDCPVVGLSGDGSRAVAVSLTNPAVLHQVDLTSHTVTSSVTITGHTISMAYEVAVNFDGSKAYVGVSNNESALARFATSDFVLFSQTYTAYWIGTSPDHSLAISGQYRFSIIDFASETMIGQYQGNTQYRGAVSPVGTRVVGFDPYRHEGVYFYDYANPAAPQYRGTTNSGDEPEGDAPRRIAITPDGTKAIVTNVLSDNITIIDLASYLVDTIIPIGDRVQNVAITADGLYAVICGFNTNSVQILDLATNEIVADVPTNTRSGVVSISPDDHYAYIGNISSNTVSVVELAGAASSEIAEMGCGVIGVVWAAYGVSSDVEINPAGDYVLVAASFDNQVKVIDTVTNTVVASITVGEFPIQIDFDSSGYYATITNAFSDDFSIIHVDGASSSLVGTFAGGDYPMRLAYNAIQDEMGIGHYLAKTLVHVNPRTGGVISTDYYTSYGSLIQVIFDEFGEPIVLTGPITGAAGHLHRGTDVIPLPAAPSYFDYSPIVQKAAVAMPGPDFVTVIEWEGPAVKEVVTIPLTGSAKIRAPAPNPCRDRLTIHMEIPQPRIMSASVYDVIGRKIIDLVHDLPVSGLFDLTWSGRDEMGRRINPGVYQIVITIGSSRWTKKVVVCEP